jgi:hypothetical protein
MLLELFHYLVMGRRLVFVGAFAAERFKAILFVAGAAAYLLGL